MKIPKPIENLIESFESLPGIGPKTAERLTFYLLHFPQEDLDRFAEAFSNLKQTKICKICKNVGEKDLCSVCENSSRDTKTICVVESPLDVIAIEKSGYRGVYHVLHGKINPIAGIGPDELFIKELVERVKEGSGVIREIILAVNNDLEGEATAMYVAEKLKIENSELKISRIGRGLPTGGDIEYADETTLRRALDGRTDV